MKISDFIQFLFYFIVLLSISPYLGRYMAKVFAGEHHLLIRVLGPVEKGIYRLSGIDPKESHNWKRYTLVLLVFNLTGFVVLFALLMFQKRLGFAGGTPTAISWHLAMNTAISFVTNTNWQSYGGETTLTTIVQMTGLTVQNFVSAATGMTVMVALIRGITGRQTDRLGNFWVDLTRSTLYILLPLSIILATFLVGEGVIQNFHHTTEITTLEGRTQTLPGGPVASQVAIKQLGTNGGGYFNANSSHPFENPTPLSNFLEMLAILLIPAGLTFTYGQMTGMPRQGRTIFAAMLLMLLINLAVIWIAETRPNPAINGMISMEGKETRFGIANSVLWADITSAASNGSVNSMHDSFTPLGGMIPLINIMLGEIIFGGVGSGIYGMVMFIVLTVFIAGLMVGRTPEYLGKKIGAFEVQMAMIAILLPALIILLFSAIAIILTAGLDGISNPGPHGLTEVVYAFSSAAGNNGSAFAGLNSNTPFYNIMLGLAMLIGRYGVIIPVLAFAGSMAKKNITPAGSGTFRTDTPLFAGLLIAVIAVVGGLTFFPVLSLGPIAEHLLMAGQHLF